VPGKGAEKALRLGAGVGGGVAPLPGGEPIAARPVSRAGRGWRWCRRNPAVAALLATVFLLLSSGVTVATVLALLADRRADEAAEARGTAEQEAERARTKEAEAVAARDDLQKSRDRLEESVARSLLRPLAMQTLPKGQSVVPLTDVEVDALWELAVSSEESLRYRFLEEALRRPMTTRQLKERASFALHAAVGLDARRRARVEELLRQELLKKDIALEQQINVALTLSRFGLRDPTVVERAAHVLAQAMSKTTDSNALRELAQGLSAVAARMEPKEAAAVHGQVAAALVQTMSETTDYGALGPLAEILSAVATRLEPKEAAAMHGQAAAMHGQIAATLAQAMTKTTDLDALMRLAHGLSAVAARLEPKEAVAVCGQAAAPSPRP